MVTVVQNGSIKLTIPTRYIARLVSGVNDEGENTLMIYDIHGQVFSLAGPGIRRIEEDIILDMEMCHSNPMLN